MPEPRVTVIIATYNRSRVLRLALASVLNQSLGDVEVWVIGDACTDDSEAVVRSCGDPRVHWHNLPVNSGSPSGPNNEGLRRARGRYVAYLSHDDLWLPWHLESLVKVFESTTAEAVCGNFFVLSADGVVGAGVVGAGDPRVGGWPGTMTGWAHEREMILRLGGWPAPGAVPMWVDSWVARRLVQEGVRLGSSSRFSSLHFPSRYLGRAYTDAALEPQRVWWDRILADADQVELDCLRALACHQTLQLATPPPVLLTLNRWRAALRYRLWPALREPPWPWSAYTIWRQRKIRNWLRRARGLPPLRPST